MKVVEAVLQYAEAKKAQTDPMKVRSFQLERRFFVFKTYTVDNPSAPVEDCR